MRFISCKPEDKKLSIKASNKYLINNSRCWIKYLITSIVWKNTSQGNKIRQIDAFSGQFIGKINRVAQSHTLQICYRGQQDKAASDFRLMSQAPTLTSTPLHRCERNPWEKAPPGATGLSRGRPRRDPLQMSVPRNLPSAALRRVTEKPTSRAAVGSGTDTPAAPTDAPGAAGDTDSRGSRDSTGLGHTSQKAARRLGDLPAPSVTRLLWPQRWGGERDGRGLPSYRNIWLRGRGREPDKTISEPKSAQGKTQWGAVAGERKVLQAVGSEA